MNDEHTSKKLFDLSGRVAVITGGSRGLGLQIAVAFAEFGGDLFLVARKEEELLTTAESLRAKGCTVDTIVADLSVPESASHIAAKAMERYGRVDILVNNAGATWGAPTEDHPLEAWQKVLSTNLTGPFLLSREIGSRAMIPARSGRILNIASVEGLKAHHPKMVGTIGYNSTKGGMVNFTRALAAEWGKYGITVNALAPGYFRSKMTQSTLNKHEAYLVSNTPLGKLGGETDLKGAALLFASDAGNHITGQILAVDGGASVI